MGYMAITGAVLVVIVVLMSLSDSIGSILSHGLDGVIIMAPDVAACSAANAESAARTCSLPV